MVHIYNYLRVPVGGSVCDDSGFKYQVVDLLTKRYIKHNRL